VVSHYDVRPVVDIYASTQERDLGSVAAEALRSFFSASDVGMIARFTKPGRPSRSNLLKQQVVANAAAK
jgi:hypothetical protein